jgi:hypothetical protein
MEGETHGGVLALLDLVEYARKHRIPGVTAIDLISLLRNVARDNYKRRAYLQIVVPDQVAKNIKGSAEERDIYFVVHIPREVLSRMESPVILPGE